MSATDCRDAAWWSGHAAGLRTALRVAEAVADLEELIGHLQPLANPTPVPTTHRFHGRHMTVTR